MKKYIAILAVILMMTSCKSKSDFQTFYDDHKSEAEFSIGVSGTIARMFIPKEEKELLGPLLKKSGKFRVMVFDENNGSIHKSLNRFVKRNNYEQLIKISDRKDKIDIYFKENEKQVIKELIIRLKSNDEIVVFACKTNLTMDDLAYLGSSLNVSMN